MDTPRFQHAPLDEEKSSIRLVKLRPRHIFSKGKDKISLEITHHRTASAPVDQALSYTWGSIDDMHIIKLNGLE